MNTLTEYRKPRPHYVPADAGWYPATGWELVDGVWQRGWRRRGVMATQAHGLRKAQVWRAEGAWTWRVIERGWRGRWAVAGRAAKRATYFTAQAAWPFAELAATTK